MLNQAPYPYGQQMTHTTFFSKVMNLFGLSLFVAAMGAWASWQWSVSLFIPALILEFVFLLGLIFIRQNQQLRALLFSLFSLTTGVTLVPLLHAAIAVGGAAIVVHALGITGITFFALSVYAIKSQKDFSFLGGILFAGVIGLMIAGFARFFFHSPLFTLGYSMAGVFIFSGFVLYDMSNIQRRYADDQYVDAALALYLDFLNLFVLMLQLLMSFSGKNRD